MKVISEANETVLKILNNFKRTSKNNRLLHFCATANVDDGILLFNLLTREIVFLTEEEYRNATELDYLKDRWFIIPENTKEKEYVDLVRFYLKRQQKNLEEITTYTIFPTTDCNARCFYCFELGRSRINMTNETALKVVQYIKKHCHGKQVNIQWFGGEPLFNIDAVNTICDGLTEEGIKFSSQMVTNGYLFDDSNLKLAVNSWNLRKVQITLDGTEKVYNKIKAYIYKKGNPYHTVLKNIERLLDASIKVSIRLNMDLYNAENLLELAKELAQRFGGRNNIHVYAYHLFKDNIPMAQMHTPEEWKARDSAMQQIEQKLDEAGLASTAGLSNKLKHYHCMADSGTSVTILPDGNIGLCEHYTETEHIGHINCDDFDRKIVNSWKELAAEISECASCFYLPDCYKLKKCSSECECYPQYRFEQLRKIQRKMKNEYLKKLNSENEK